MRRRRSAGVAAGWPTPGRPRRTRASTAGCGRRRWRRSSSAASSTSRPRRRSRTKQLLPSAAERPPGRAAPGSGTRPTSGTYQPEAGTRLINTFFDSGRVDDSLYEPAARRLHARRSRSRRWQGHRGLDGRPRAAHGRLAALDGSPGAQARALRAEGQRDRCGRVYPIVLGLGGWFLGVLIVITTMPGVPLDNAAARDLSVGVPVGLGIYWAWVRPRLAGLGASVSGFAAASAGALVGAWLGFHAGDRPARRCHRDRRSGRRRQPRADRPRHVPGPIHPESVRRTYDEGGCA